MAKTIIKSWPDLNKARAALDKEKDPIYIDGFDFPLVKKKMTGKKYFIRTYGCQSNIRDEETIKGILAQFGMNETTTLEEATVVIVNTCAIRENAQNKVYGELGELKRLKTKNKNLLVGLCGCMVHQPEVLSLIKEKFPFINFIFGTDQLGEIGALLDEVIRSEKNIINVQSGAGRITENLPSKRSSSKQAFVNIMYGCDKYCTYCIVPFTRGRQRSRLPKDILKEVQELKDKGYLEITLLGQNVNAYGKDFEDNETTFASLLEAVAKIGIPRVRFLTSHPWDFSPELIKTIKDNENIVRFLHLPIQSGSTKVLKEMGRRYSYEDYKKIYLDLKKEIPEMAFSTDIIVGYPTETYEEFQQTINAVKELEFSQFFTFIFSPRLGTPAAKIESVASDEEHAKWFKELNEVCADVLAKQNEDYVGRTIDVLVESISKKNDQMLTGYTPENKTIHFPGGANLIGTIVKVKVTSARTYAIFGEIIHA